MCRRDGPGREGCIKAPRTSSSVSGAGSWCLRLRHQRSALGRFNTSQVRPRCLRVAGRLFVQGFSRMSHQTTGTNKAVYGDTGPLATSGRKPRSQQQPRQSRSWVGKEADWPPNQAHGTGKTGT
ncbi:predicted protein [Chaetomium globosum CBS 148.51]|uniref:Uncharacterized protein n=1 Tax=Chaetomium globosum (strain ATCC 6205 / CBS 148.51 / DSM 1962 / NBRC 6347 / NRRL 1970) TaxID=306901 RepID=Q2GXR6_CHAGB|nr:uncharacterized protein CHGG_07238 [Chaetomium globosum CBS 148.51]EAQ85985.1 predicted protein [Chaetomium globosum CBS 148.51]